MNPISIEELHSHLSSKQMERRARLEHFLIMLSAAALPLYLSMFRYNIAGMYVRLADLVVISFLLLALIYFPEARRQFLNRTILPAYLFVAIMLLYGLASNNMMAALKESIQFFYVVFFLLVSSIFIRNHPEQFRNYLIAFLCISVLYTLLYHFSIGSFLRYKSASEGKYAFGLLSILLFLTCYTHGWRKPFSVLFFISLVPLLMSLERKGIFGVFLTITLAYLYQFLKKLRLANQFLVLLIAFSGVFLTAILLPDISAYYSKLAYANLFVDEEQALWVSNIHRASLLINGLDIFIQNPLFGIGADKVKSAMSAYYFDPRLANDTHNFYLNRLIENGLVGLTLILSIIFLRMKYSLPNITDKVTFLLFCIYCYFVTAFMSNGQASFLLFFYPGFVGWMFFKDNSVSSGC